MATTGSDLKEFQRVEVVVAPYQSRDQRNTEGAKTQLTEAEMAGSRRLPARQRPGGPEERADAITALRENSNIR
jgi:hypothetical protein